MKKFNDLGALRATHRGTTSPQCLLRRGFIFVLLVAFTLPLHAQRYTAPNPIELGSIRQLNEKVYDDKHDAPIIRKIDQGRSLVYACGGFHIIDETINNYFSIHPYAGICSWFEWISDFQIMDNIVFFCGYDGRRIVSNNNELDLVPYNPFVGYFDLNDPNYQTYYIKLYELENDTKSFNNMAVWKDYHQGIHITMSATTDNNYGTLVDIYGTPFDGNWQIDRMKVAIDILGYNQEFVAIDVTDDYVIAGSIDPSHQNNSNLWLFDRRHYDRLFNHDATTIKYNGKIVDMKIKSTPMRNFDVNYTFEKDYILERFVSDQCAHVLCRRVSEMEHPFVVVSTKGQGDIAVDAYRGGEQINHLENSTVNIDYSDLIFRSSLDYKAFHTTKLYHPETKKPLRDVNWHRAEPSIDISSLPPQPPQPETWNCPKLEPELQILYYSDNGSTWENPNFESHILRIPLVWLCDHIGEINHEMIYENYNMWSLDSRFNEDDFVYAVGYDNFDGHGVCHVFRFFPGYCDLKGHGERHDNLCIKKRHVFMQSFKDVYPSNKTSIAYNTFESGAWKENGSLSNGGRLYIKCQDFLYPEDGYPYNLVISNQKLQGAGESWDNTYHAYFYTATSTFNNNPASSSLPYNINNANYNAIQADVTPNPATDRVTISSNDNIQQVIVYDALGRQVLKEASSNNFHSLDVSSLPKGIYSVLIRTDSDTVTKKLLVE